MTLKRKKIANGVWFVSDNASDITADGKKTIRNYTRKTITKADRSLRQQKISLERNCLVRDLKLLNEFKQVRKLTTFIWKRYYKTHRTNENQNKRNI